MEDVFFLSKIFYKSNNKTSVTILNVILLLIYSIIVAVLSIISLSPVIMALGILGMFAAFFTLGKTGGFVYTIIYFLSSIIALFNSRELQQLVPNLVLLFAMIIYAIMIMRLMGEIEERESRQRIAEEEIEKNSVEYEEQITKIKAVIAANKSRVKNYRILNDVAQKLTSTLEKKDIVAIISGAIATMIGSKEVKFNLLIKDEETDTFFPALEERVDDTVLTGTVKLYKTDPFDEWMEKNKFTLVIKNIDEDFRFKTLRKDWIKFKSMIAIPLISNKGIIGILKFYSHKANVFDKEDARLLNYLGDLSATAVQNTILYQKTKELAIRDGLTGLFMRRYFIERMDDELRRSKELNEPFSYLMIDIDHFKDCNDTYGHLFGDKVLRMLGEFLKENLRDVDIIGRYGGEEFAVVLPNTSVNGARFVAERLRQSFEKLIINVSETEGIKLTLSVGGVEYKDKMKLMEIINYADKALYFSKENGRNKVTFSEDITK